MNNEMEDFDFDQAVREQYAQVVSGAAMNMSDWEDEEPSAIRRILRSPDRARRFLERLDPLNRYIEEELLPSPPSGNTLILLNRLAKYYSNCILFCALWLSRNALKAYLHDQKRLPGTPEIAAEDILSATTDSSGILSSLHSLYHVLYCCPRDELIADYRSVVAEFLEDYLDICLAVADDPEVRRLRDFLRDFFAYEYQPVLTRPTTRAEYDNLPAMKFPELSNRWQAAAFSYSISFAHRLDSRTPVPAHIVSIDETVKSGFLNSIANLFRRLKPAKTPSISLAEAAAITNLSVDQLRYLESKPKDSQNGYPGRSGTNIEFVKTALSHWAANHLSAQRAEKAIKAGLKNPLHRPGL